MSKVCELSLAFDGAGYDLPELIMCENVFASQVEDSRKPTRNLVRRVVVL